MMALNRPAICGNSEQVLRHLIQSLRGDEQIAVAGQQKRWRTDRSQPAGEIHLLDHVKTMGHHALVGLPALPCHEVEQRPRLLPAAAKSVARDSATVASV